MAQPQGPQQIEPGRLYDSTGTLVPLSGDPPPSFSPSLVPPGVEREIHDRYRNYPSRDLSPARIEAILELADIGEPLEWIQLCEEMIEKDPKIGSVLHTRTAAVLGIDHNVQAAELEDENSADQTLADDIASFCEDALDRGGVDDLLADLLDSIGKPLAVDWIDWGNDATGRIVPLRFQRIPPTHLRWGYTSDSIRVWSPTGFVMTKNDIGTPLDPYTTVRALNNERRDNPTRAGLCRTLVWYYLFKNTSIKDWVTLADRFGMPTRILSLSPDDFRNSEMYEKARGALKMLGSSASGVISNDWKLDMASAAAKGGADLFNSIITYIDTAIAQLVLGHELSSQGSKGGGQLGISAANQVRQDILEGDCTFLASVLRRDLLTPMVGWNFGWENTRLTPYFEFDLEPAKDLVADANVISTIARTFPTLTYSKQQLRDRYDFNAPLTPDGAELSPDDADDAISAGAVGQANQPIKAPAIPGEPPDVSVSIQSTLASRPGSRVKRSRTAAAGRQRKVDAVVKKSAAAGAVETTKWLGQLRTMIREGVAQGLTIPDMAHRISKSYPDFDVTRLETLLHEQLVLVRLFGRNS